MSALPAPLEDSTSASAQLAGSSPAPALPLASTEGKPDPNQSKQEEENEDPKFATEKPDQDAQKPEGSETAEVDDAAAPPLPDEVPPPLPDEAPPAKPEDDGWEPAWDHVAQKYYFYNRFTGVSQWDNPRVPQASVPAAPGTEVTSQEEAPRKAPVLGGYNPAIHGDYDPTAPYAQQYEEQEPESSAAGQDAAAAYAATGTFNRFTGRWQAAEINPENHNDENKSRRQMNAFFDVDAAANSHDGRSLRAERSARKLTKAELKQFKEKRREKKEEKRRAWLRD
ncbi:hypothetical protein PENANT_c004G07640 [Penicillium antarcticum]|uniref:WW domain-containing protein n=1 Tax=Penicillium antarcticum TaxID=416450 RepID=A0A1V6QHF4_9EURO|nr:uncharacterized protein N7508_002212 [Penicillium antarcticum]KAJ5317704.1 hypothetical protein N7508_002212 [Penicillium antarcticum]OQD88286.1 hypothetical protein PENANT_c004G07640 [Penicillium antarcticum]